MCLLCMTGKRTSVDDLDYLEEVDLLALGLPSVAHDVMVKGIQKGLCKPPIVLDFGAAVQDLQAPLEVWLLDQSSTISIGVCTCSKIAVECWQHPAACLVSC